MRLRSRVFLLVALASLASGVAGYFAVSRLLLDSYLALEQDAVRAEAARARDALFVTSASLAATNADRGERDVTRAAFGADAGAGNRYVDPATLQSLELSHVALVTRAGRLRTALAYDARTNSTAAIGDDYRAMIAAAQRALRKSGLSQLVGLVRTQSGGLELVAIVEVRATGGQAPGNLAPGNQSPGDLLFARAVGLDVAQQLADVVHREVALYDPATLPRRGPDDLWVTIRDDNNAYGWFVAYDLGGAPVLVGRVAVTREVYAQARETMNLIGLVIFVICLLAPVLAEFAIDRLVVSRIRALRDWAKAVGGGGSLAFPVAANGSDEVADLSASIASMATHLQGVQKDLENSREQADRANRAKSDFLAGASHEIRTPLTAILGYAELLLDRKLSAEEYYHYLNTIRGNGEDLLDILNDILDLSKVEAGRLDLSWERADVAAIIAGVVSLLNLKAAAKGLSLSMHCATDVPTQVFIDPQRFRQIVVNLVGNAIRYTDRGSVTVTLSVDLANPVSAVLRLAVRDTGIGISAEQALRLFRPFTQLAGGARRAGGTGLGLALSQEFARAMGGAIQVESVPGEGSTFTLAMPAGDLRNVAFVKHDGVTVSTPEQGADEDLQQFPGSRVLLVEDNAVNRLLVEKLLERLGVTVVADNDGAQALARLLGHGETFDLVLLDMHMPEVDGYTVARRLRAAGYRGTVVALTASAMSGERERALAAGCDDFMAKPLQARVFLRSCRQWLAGKEGRAT